MFGKVNKSAIVKWSIILSIILLLYFYNILHSAIIFHSPNKYEYLEKIVCTYSGEQDKLYIDDYIATYKIPCTYNWNEDDEIAIFIKNMVMFLKNKILISGDLTFS